MRKIISCVLWLLAVSVTSQYAEELFELNIIHYNDFHAHFDEVSPRGGICNPAEAPCIGGFARLYTAIKQALEVEPDSLVLNGGDTFQGTIWYNFLRWNVTQYFMNKLPHDAHAEQSFPGQPVYDKSFLGLVTDAILPLTTKLTSDVFVSTYTSNQNASASNNTAVFNVLGNHEFDHGVEGLLPYLRHLESHMLGANVNTTFEEELGQYVKNHVVVVKRGRKIGIIGILLQRFSAPIGGVIMEDELEAVRREAAILTEQGVDIIVVLSHIGYTADLNLAARMPPEVDIVVGAHTHTLLFNGDTPDGSTAAGEYPTVVTQSNGHRILVVQASCCTRYLGDIKLYFNKDGIIEKWEGTPIYLGTSIVQDPGMLRELEPWRDQVNAIGKEVLGRSAVALARGCNRGECSLGSWACDGFLEELIPRANDTRWNDGQVCLINTGGLRTQINPGEVTTEALLMAIPFENYVQVYDLKGRYLLEALEFSVGVAQTDPQVFNSARMLQIGGMRVVYNASAPVGSRVVSANVRCIACAVPRFAPLDPDASYRVVTQDYIGNGGGGYTMLSNNRENLVNLEVDYTMLQRYMRRQTTVVQGLDGRIQIVY